MQTCFDHLGGFQVIAIDGDGFRYNLAIFPSGSVNVHLESGYQHRSGHFLFAQAKKTFVVGTVSSGDR